MGIKAIKAIKVMEIMDYLAGRGMVTWGETIIMLITKSREMHRVDMTTWETRRSSARWRSSK